MTVILWGLMAALPELAQDAPLEVRYTGTVAPVSGLSEQPAIKQFTLHVVLARTDNDSLPLEGQYFLEERGSGGWAWPERFGRVQFDAHGEVVRKSTPKLLMEYGGNNYVLDLPPIVFGHADRLQTDASWESGEYTYHVGGKKKLPGAEGSFWFVEATHNRGRHRRLWVRPDTPLLQKAEQRVFMGRGDQFLLRVEQVRSRPAAEFGRWQAAFTALLRLKEQLGRSDTETRPEIPAEKLAVAEKELPNLEKLAADTELAEFVQAVRRDVSSQQRRTDQIAGLVQRYEGRTAEPFSLKLLDGKTLSADQLAGKIVVLHFWDYRHEPLKEPYGQVGYLDFLHHRRAKLGVTIVGVAVNESLSKPATQAKGRSSARKLAEFMNLSYPIATDDGTLLEQFGDPRKLGADLPLFVVLDGERKIAHYHVGFYEIRPDRGLEALDTVLLNLIRRSREK